MPVQPVKARCSPATFAALAKLQQDDTKAAAAYKASLNCSLGSTDPKGYVGTWGADKGKLFPFAATYTDPNQNMTGTCYANLQNIDAATWNSLPIASQTMTKNSFCNLATVGENTDKAGDAGLAKLSKDIISTAAEIYTKIQNMEKENLVYYKQHQKLDDTLTKNINTYTGFLTELNRLQKINSQPDITLGGQMEDAKLKSQSGYYQFILWATLATIIFSYTMHNLWRKR